MIKLFLNSKYFSFSIITGILILLFHGILKTYAFTDGYEFIWNASENDFLTTFIQQGRALSGWIISKVFPHIQQISDYSYLRVFNLICLFVAALLIHKILLRNNFSNYHSLLITLIFICSPYASVIVHWEATSSCIWGLPFALLSGEIIFTNLLKKESIGKKRFYFLLILGIIIGIISLFIYQPAFTAAVFPAFIYFITNKKQKYIWQFIAVYMSVFIIYFLIFKIQLSLFNIPPNERAGLDITSNKFFWFMKGAFIRSFQYSLIVGAASFINAVKIISLAIMAFFIYKKYKEKEIKNPIAFVLMLILFYILAYLPSYIAADNWISFRTMSAIAMLSSTLLVYAIIHIPLKIIYTNTFIFIITVCFIFLAYNNNTLFTDVAEKEYHMVKNEIAEKLKISYPDSITVIMPDEYFLANQKIIKNIVTDEFGKLSNSVDWAATTCAPQLIFEITQNRVKAKNIPIDCYYRSNLPKHLSDSQSHWVLDVEKIYLSTPNHH